MILRSAAASPFGRKVKIAAEILGLASRISVLDTDTMSPDDSIRRENPLGKIPTLVLDDGRTFYDSRVIVAYLDHLGGGRLIPAEPEARFEALRLEALADGICDAALLQVYEGRFRASDTHCAKWLDHQAGKVARGLASIEAAVPGGQVTVGQVRVGHVATACMLGYLDLRFAGTWRKDHPRLVAWLALFAAAVPAFEATRVKS